jgi:hypothetical protein
MRLFLVSVTLVLASTLAGAAADGAALLLAASARCGGRRRHQARQPQLPGTGDHRLSQERRHVGKAAATANHASTRTTQLYDRGRDEVSLDEVEQVNNLKDHP